MKHYRNARETQEEHDRNTTETSQKTFEKT